MNRNEIKDIIDKAIQTFIETDSYLMENDVHEQTITGKIACYILRILEDRFNSSWNVDVEYNRNMELPKSLQRIGNVKPDILIHKRGLNNPKNIEENNLLIVETKKNPNKTDHEKDTKKIKAFINEDPYHYKYGVFISVITDNKEVKSEWFYRETEGDE